MNPPWNRRLIGVAGSRYQLDTPALLIEYQPFKRNIARMAAFAKERGVKLRPHSKTHKSVDIARLQCEAGAAGVCCTTLDEAELMVGGGIPGVLITSPIVTAGKIERLMALARKAGPGGLMIVVDHPDNLRDLAHAASGLLHPLDVLVDYAAGYYRTGAATSDDVLALARAVEAAPQLTLRGLQAYAGNLQHIPQFRERAAATAALRLDIASLIRLGREQGIHFEIVSGGGTGSHDLDSSGDVFTELQPGSYIFMDISYCRALADSPLPCFETSLFVQTSVVSTNAPDWVTTDAGVKSFAVDGPPPEVARGAAANSRYMLFGDEHGKLSTGDPDLLPCLGAKLELLTPHCDPTVNLYDWFHVVDADRLVALWPIGRIFGHALIKGFHGNGSGAIQESAQTSSIPWER